MAVKKITNLKKLLGSFRKDREYVKTLGEDVKDRQIELIAALKVLDPKNVGVVYDDSDESKGTAYVQQNSAGEFWDEEAIIDYLHKHPSLWRSCSSRVFDVRKWEAEVANGIVSSKIARRFKITGDAPAPFIRFGKRGKDSLS